MRSLGQMRHKRSMDLPLSSSTVAQEEKGLPQQSPSLTLAPVTSIKKIAAKASTNKQSSIILNSDEEWLTAYYWLRT